MADTNLDFSTKYSLSSLLNNLLRINQNSLAIINKLSDSVNSPKDVVEVDIIDSNNLIKKVFIPSYGKLKNDITRIDNNIKQLSGVGEANANVQLEDGSFRKLIVSDLKLEGNTIDRMTTPTNFATKSNWFFESFLNPLLYVSYDFTGQIPSDTERAKLQRFILNLDTTAQRNAWETELNGKSNLDYVSFFELLLKYNITYFLDEDVIDMPPRSLRYFGDFNVTQLYDNEVEEIVDGVTTTKRKLQVALRSLNYNDASQGTAKSQQLKGGDSLVIVTPGSSKNTRFKIDTIDIDTGNVIQLSRLEGHDIISINTVFSYYNEESNAISLDVNIGFGEYNVIFVKPINPVTKIPANNWSPGSAFYTNSLQIIDSSGEQVNLAEYYREKVVDFGVFLYNMAKDGIPPATLAETPNIPSAATDDFQVLQINNHITDVERIDKIKSLQTEKLSIQSELDSLNGSIKNKKADMNTKRYTSQSQRDTDQAELNELINGSSSASTLLKSAVDEIIALAESDNLEGITPKYRVKGFWPVPDAVISPKTGAQAVIQFRIQYRYLSKDGGANQPSQITFTDNNGVKRQGTFSAWEEFLTPVRKRSQDPNTGNYSWDTEDVENADAVNINQLEIPIKQGEGVEMRLQSISEAGWPANPAESDWTSNILVEFPDELVGTDDLITIVEQARLTSESLEITAALADTGVTEHISEQFTQNQTFYAHTTSSIASGFLTDEQNVVNLFEKLSEFSTRIRLIEEALTGEKGKLSVNLVDAREQYPIVPNTVLKLFAGNYKDEVSSLDIKKGVIVNKTYLLQLTNVNASPLELYARQYGVYTSRVDYSTVGATGYDANDTDYNTTRRYDVTPLGPSNYTSAFSTYKQFQPLPYQTGQVKGQFINIRYENVDSTEKLYENIDSTTPGFTGQISATLPANGTQAIPWPAIGTPLANYGTHEYLLSPEYLTTIPAAAGTSAGQFIWSGTFNLGIAQTVPTTTVVDWGRGIYVHYAHPYLPSWGTVTGPIQPFGVGAAGPTGIRNSGFAPIPASDITSGSVKQAAYYWWNNVTTGASAGQVSKMSFESVDQYLLGPNSMGAYLFLSPRNNTGAINVAGANSLSQYILNFGTKYAVSIPLVFQYRMTDYFGDGDTGIGNIGGDISGVTQQIEYTKRIGLDIYSNIDERFSFDVEITSRYRSTSLQLQEVPFRSLENVVDDLTRTVKVLNPSVRGSDDEYPTSPLLGALDK